MFTPFLQVSLVNPVYNMNALATRLFEAAGAGNIAECDAIIAQGCPVDATHTRPFAAPGCEPNPKETALHEAARRNKGSVCTYLVLCGANVHARDSLGRTPLHMAAEYEACDAIASLLDHGATHCGTDPEGVTPLHMAVRRNDLAACQLLLDRGANVNQLCSVQSIKLPPLMYASTPEMCALLLQRGADVDFVDSRESTMLTHAIHRRDFEMCKVLLEHGAKLNPDPHYSYAFVCIPNCFGCMDGKPVEFMTSGVRMLKMLIEKGLDIHVPWAFNGDTALHYAARLDKPWTSEYCKVLLSHGAKHVANREGYTPLHRAAQTGNDEACELLIRNGANARADAALMLDKGNPDAARRIRDVYDRICAQTARTIRLEFVAMEQSARVAVVEAEQRAKEAEDKVKALEEALAAATLSRVVK